MLCAQPNLMNYLWNQSRPLTFASWYELGAIVENQHLAERNLPFKAVLNGFLDALATQPMLSAF